MTTPEDPTSNTDCKTALVEKADGNKAFVEAIDTKFSADDPLNGAMKFIVMEMVDDQDPMEDLARIMGPDDERELTLLTVNTCFTCHAAAEAIDVLQGEKYTEYLNKLFKTAYGLQRAINPQAQSKFMGEYDDLNYDNPTTTDSVDHRIETFVNILLDADGVHDEISKKLEPEDFLHGALRFFVIHDHLDERKLMKVLQTAKSREEVLEKTKLLLIEKELLELLEDRKQLRRLLGGINGIRDGINRATWFLQLNR